MTGRSARIRSLVVLEIASVCCFCAPMSAHGQQANQPSTNAVQATHGPKNYPTTGPAFKSQPQARQTPAQQRYGVPVNPLTGPPASLDLTQALTLDHAIAVALQRQNSIAIALAQRNASREGLVIARSSYFPQITPTYQYQATLTPIRVPGTSTGKAVSPLSALSNRAVSAVSGDPIIEQNNESHSGSIVARQLIWDTGKREASVGLARQDMFASEFNLANTRQDVILAVTVDYYELLRTRSLVQVQQANVQNAQTAVNAVQAELKAGVAAASDVYQPEAQLENARVSLLTAQNDALVAEANLKNAMGVVSSVPIVLASNQSPTPATTPDTTPLETYVQTAYANRLDVKQQQDVINAQGYNVRLARINAGLSVSASVDEGYQVDPYGGEERTFLVTFSYPLFDAGATRAAVKQSEDAMTEQEQSLDALEQTVQLQVDQDYHTREVAKQEVAAAAVAANAAQINYNAAEAELRTGIINVLNVVQAELQLVTAQVQQVDADYAYYEANARLLRDLGENDPAFVPNAPSPFPKGVIGMGQSHSGVREASASVSSKGSG